MKLNEINYKHQHRLERLNNALAELVRDEDDDILDDEQLEAELQRLAVKHNLNTHEVNALRTACEGPIGGPFEKYPT